MPYDFKDPKRDPNFDNHPYSIVPCGDEAISLLVQAHVSGWPFRICSLDQSLLTHASLPTETPIQHELNPL